MKIELSKTERHILKEMGFVCHVEHPHKFISNYLMTLGTPQELRQEAWNLANDRYFSESNILNVSFYSCFVSLMCVVCIFSLMNLCAVAFSVEKIKIKIMFNMTINFGTKNYLFRGRDSLNKTTADIK